jgi:alkanesulfonate monooxygenase SsuD/methylene tetrahydromethanopterin reductase-like flavin-dependent oxidoreductase (luciferase family)
MSALRVGILPPRQFVDATLDERRRRLAAMADAGLDHVGLGDHVSFFVGAGHDALVGAGSFLSLHDELPAYIGVYLLPLRHPVPVARQLATLAEIAPGRLTLGVGIGGEDRHEVEVCGVDPKTRGRRMDECLTVVRALLTGEPVTFHGEFFDLEDALIVPAPDPPIPIVVGGRSEAAVLRAARHGDGWIGIWVSPRRYASAVEQIREAAAEAGRDGVAWEHGLNVWCGLASSRDEARGLLAAGMEDFYRIPFSSFERYSPWGEPADVAEFLAGYVEAGCGAINLIPCAPDWETAVEGCAEVRRVLQDHGGSVK